MVEDTKLTVLQVYSAQETRGTYSNSLRPMLTGPSLDRQVYHAIILYFFSTTIQQ